MNKCTSAEWQACFGTDAPQRLSAIAQQAIAWQEQVLVHGDVSPAIARDLRVVASEVAAARTKEALQAVPSAHQDRTSTASRTAHTRNAVAQAGRSALPTASSQLQPGTRLVKAHGGRNHVVQVTASGFDYEGQQFASLSAIARHITGTHWNGLLFFGLRQRKTYPRRAHV
ncbi:DUF2924 domain-containing protein [Sphingomonas sp. CFBP 13720]|uniref:DUF2924 domain-containing protein n=1 Tax=Sphingomonas sp. CFBP 13720 TaxID=2775302 RepID=UPI0017862AA4|nr:DUF2924 domain-containing protein [Sphingomonas sp. CFBP 13720]MBD8676855.1 DUF2924 domain-containing protein [Sphingomonas sp. CFBP 13720]